MIKPNTSNVTTFDKYIVCKNFIYNENKVNQYKINYYRLENFLKKLDTRYITSIFDFDLPYYFITKLDDMNITIGQQQLEHMNQTISRGKHLETDITKKQKLNSWNEKGNFHYNKGVENKGNIFLQGPLKKEDINNVNGKTPNGFLCNKKLLVENDNVDEPVFYKSIFTLANFEETEHMRSTTPEAELVRDTNYKTDSDNTPSCFDIV